jgi:putative phosphoribosyl transferase
MLFEDRRDAGRQLSAALRAYAGRPDVIILALPRGGVPVAFEVARALSAPLDIFVVRKLGVPGQEELALGALASGGVRVLNSDVVQALAIGHDEIARVTARELPELERREHEYRGDHPPLDVRGRIVILIDDGLATGSTMRAAVAALRRMHPAKIVVAVPVGAAATCESLQAVADEVICLNTPEQFFAVGQWYRYFEQTSDEEVRELLKKSIAEQQQAGR